LLSDSAILWTSKKLSCIALSTMKVEYVVYAAATQDIIWLKSFLNHFKIIKSASDPVTIYFDNTTAVAMVKDPKYHGKTKHIKIRYYYIRDAITKYDVILKHIYTNSMVADPFTKPIAMDAFARHLRFIGLYRM